MAIIAFIIGSVLGLIGAAVSVGLLGMGIGGAFMVYMGLSVTLPLLALVPLGLDDDDGFGPGAQSLRVVSA